MREISREGASRTAARHAGADATRQARRKLLIWLAVIGFILGTAICGFSPKDRNNEGISSGKEKNTMAVTSNSVMTAAETRPVYEAIPAAMETATFAMG
jgi:hypothetical protein